MFIDPFSVSDDVCSDSIFSDDDVSVLLLILARSMASSSETSPQSIKSC